MGYKVNRKKCNGYIILSFDKIPKHCGECQLYQENSFYDEDSGWGSGIRHSCPFGGDVWGCLIERPQNCPIITRDNKSDKLK